LATSIVTATAVTASPDAIKRRQAFKENLDLAKIRGQLNQMIGEYMQQAGAPQ
jgi:hypothetical protein